MSRVRLNLANRSLASIIWSAPLSGWLLTAAGAILLCVALVFVWRMNGQLETARQAQQSLLLQMERDNGSAVAAPATRLSPAQVTAVNTAVRQLNLPWSEIFDALEASSSPRVGLLELNPQAEAGMLKGSAEARNLEDMIAYIRKLKTQEFFTDAVLTGHQVNEQDRNKPVRFEFLVSWSNP